MNTRLSSLLVVMDQCSASPETQRPTNSSTNSGPTIRQAPLRPVRDRALEHGGRPGWVEQRDAVYEAQGLLIVTREQIRPNCVENLSGLANHLSRIYLLGLQLGNLGGDVLTIQRACTSYA